MSKFIKDDHGIMGLTLSHIGLIIATGILLTAVFSIIFLNDWQRNAELKNIATSFSTIVEGMDTRFFENTTEFHFPDKTYYYNVSISTEYVIVSAEGNQNNKLSIKERFIVKPWPRTSDQTWKTGEELHNYCLYTYGHSGTILDPIVQADLDELNIYKENAGIYLVSNPLYFKINKPVYIEKVIIYYGIAEKQDFLLIYQLE
jgi:hypothetical protein